MSKLTLSEFLIDATPLLEVGELTSDERHAICETIRDLIGQETVLSHSRAQREWLVTKAWATVAGSNTNNKVGRSYGPRDRMNWDRIRAIFADLPAQK